jgi:hypothetical protein
MQVMNAQTSASTAELADRSLLVASKLLAVLILGLMAHFISGSCSELPTIGQVWITRRGSVRATLDLSSEELKVVLV